MKVALIMGSKSDYPALENAEKVLDDFGVEYETRVMSAHRTPQEAMEFAESAEGKGFGVIIAAAGMAAHLAGVLAANTTIPVIGIPIASGGLGGLDALLATVQMPSGIPVATVAVNGAANAGHLAAQILALSDDELKAKVQANKVSMRLGVVEKDKKIQQLADEV